jgi:hypothetical protein
LGLRFEPLDQLPAVCDYNVVADALKHVLAFSVQWNATKQRHATLADDHALA